MKRGIQFILIFLAFSFMSCEEIFMHPDPGTDNLSLFDEYSKICIEKYGLEDVKGVDLTALADSIRPFITPDLSEAELFSLMGLFVDRMQEGHTSLISVDQKYSKSYYWFTGYPPAANILLDRKYYYGEEANPDVRKIPSEDSYFQVFYGYLPQDKEIGYIHIISFSVTITDAELEEMMKYLKDAKGIIIDVRNNLGGYIDLVGRLASYFTDTEVLVATNYIKNGPGKDDFAASEMKIEPSGSPYTYAKPVVVLQDRITFSSGSLFCVVMSAMDNTTTIGQRFGGGTGAIVDGFLANGWQWTVSTSNFVDIKGRPTEPGIDPEIEMLINPADTSEDDVLERAILELQ
jgi:hypothetical protein